MAPASNTICALLDRKAVSMFSLVQLTHFVAVAEELHFGRAAERLGMTQPPLSRQIQLLERDLGVQLFNRTSRLVTLTPAGKAFLVDAHSILRESQRAALSVRKASAGKSGMLRVGFTGGSVHNGLATILSTAREVIADVEVELLEMVTTAQLDALSDSRLDIGLVRPPLTRPDLSSQSIVREDLIAAIPHGHELADSDEPLDIGRLHGVAMVMYSPFESRYFYELLSSVFHEAAVVPVPVQHLTQIHSILGLVSLGWGVALVPESASAMHFGDVVYRPLQLRRQADVELDMVWRIDNENPALVRLLSALYPDRQH